VDTEKKNLQDLRQAIDLVDSEILKQFEKRMDLCEQIAEYKIGAGRPVQDMEREKQKIAALQAQADNEFNQHSVAELFAQIMSISRKLQYQLMAERGIVGTIPFEMLPIIPKKKARVVYQGVEGSYSQAAMFQYFGREVRNFNVRTFDEAMKAICGGIADYAVLPIDNSRAGQVSDTYDLLMYYDNYIVGETYLKVDHTLLGLPGAKVEEIQTIYSHPQGLMQCSNFLAEHPGIRQISTENTAVSARKILEDGDRTAAAIAGEVCGELYGLEVLKKDIVDNPDNTTRFIIVSSKKIYSESANRVSICFEAAHETGSLYRLLSHFIYNDLNLSKIESRPVPGKAWEYRFFVDFEGNLSSQNVKNALRGVLEEAIYFKILGNY
jgi:chorismate mutase/prephenate dehydratase